MAMAQDTDTDTDTDVCNSQADCGLAPHTPITFSPVSMSPKEFFSFVQNTYLVDESRPDRFISVWPPRPSYLSSLRSAITAQART